MAAPDFDAQDLAGPEGEDWRVPVPELEARQALLAVRLREAGLPGLLVQHPIDLYYYTGGRQDATLFVPAEGAPGSTEAGGDGPVAFVRRSLHRARLEAGEDDAPHAITAFPRLSAFASTLRDLGASQAPAMQLGEVPASFATRFTSALSDLGAVFDGTAIVHTQREVKSAWEVGCMEEAAEVQLRMFEAIEAVGGEGASELDLVAAAEAVSRSEGFGGHVQMRRYPLQCDRGVIVAGRSGGVTSFFDSAVGGAGPHPLAGMGSGFRKVRADEPVLVDLVHVHRGYVVDMTRMFVAGRLDPVWQDRLDDMLSVRDEVVGVLETGGTCSQAWDDGLALATELGHADHLMGQAPDQSRFLGHSVGLQLDEAPVVAAGFDRPMPVGGTMAIEPKVVHRDGAIGSEDTWLREQDGLRPITAGGAWPWVTEW